jgi:hypothetical protein
MVLVLLINAFILSNYRVLINICYTVIIFLFVLTL